MSRPARSETSASAIPATLEPRFAAIGVAIVEYALTTNDLAILDEARPPYPGPTVGTGAWSPTIPPAAFARLAALTTLTTLASRLAGAPMQLVAAAVVDPLPAATWFLTWHQGAHAGSDLDPGPDPRLTLRVHLDPCTEDDGPLEVLPGTHEHGRLTREAIADLAATVAPLLCLTARGDIVALRPRLIRRTQRARAPTAHRAIDLDYAPPSPSREPMAARHSAATSGSVSDTP